MQKLKSIIKKVVHRDLLDIYKHDNPSKQDFFLVIHHFECLTAAKKTQFAESLAKKLDRQHTNQEILNLLLLCDFLSATNPFIFCSFPTKMRANLEAKKKLRGTTKQQKQKLAESTFNSFYLSYLHEKVWGVKSMDNITIDSLETGLAYCDSAISALKLILHHDFIVEYTVSNSGYRNQVKIAVENVLRRSSEDLAVLIRFVDKWNYLIVENKAQSVMVNDIYEQLIYISKNISKLEFLNNKIKSGLVFPRYELNKNLNTNIQRSMIGKQSEKKEFYSQKRLKTEGDIAGQEAEITESEIYMKFKL